jgi:oligopeptidase B
MRRTLPAAVLSLLAAPAAVAADPTAAAPPVAKKVPVTATLHGDTRTDDYAWIKDKKNPEVIQYLDAENAYTAAVMKPTEGFQATLYKEMLGRIKQTDLSVPTRDNGYWYYTRPSRARATRSTAARRAPPTPPKRSCSTPTSWPRGRSS